MSGWFILILVSVFVILDWPPWICFVFMGFYWILSMCFSHPFDSASVRRAAHPPRPGNHANLLHEKRGISRSLSPCRHLYGFREGIWWQGLFPPNDQEIEGVVIMLHGYSDHSDFIMLNHAQAVFNGLNGRVAVILFDQPGCGRSDGLWAFISDWEDHVNECRKFIAWASGNWRQDSTNFQVFGFGFSMGAAILLTIAVKDQEKCGFSGLVLLAPMCRSAPNLRVNNILEVCLEIAAWLFPALPVTPLPDLVDLVYRDPSFAKFVSDKNTLNYPKPLRLGTAVQLLYAQRFIMKNMELVNIPMIVLHGDNDKVTSIECSRELVARAGAVSYKDGKRTQSSLNILIELPGYPHLIAGAGQPKEFCVRPYTEIVNWIKSHSN